jgi:hypothetical protein
VRIDKIPSPASGAAVRAESSKFVSEAERRNNDTEESFNASVGCFDRLNKNKIELHNVKITCEAASANEDVAYVQRFKIKETSSAYAAKIF